MTKVVGNAKGRIRFRLILWHRLSAFEKAFDKYIKGEVPADYVASRRRKLKVINRKRKNL